MTGRGFSCGNLQRVFASRQSSKLCFFADTFRDAATDILLRSQSRLEDAMQQHLNNVAELDDIRIKEDLPPSARYMSVRLAASAKLSASRSSSALREQLRAARAAASSSVPVRVHKT